MLPIYSPIEAPSTAGIALARFDPIVAKNVLHVLAMIGVSDISSPLHSKCLGNSFGYIHFLIYDGI